MSLFKKIILINLFYINYNLLQAQSITEDAIAIEHNKFQLESIGVIEYSHANGYHLNHWIFPGILLRYGLNKHIEMRWATAYESNRKHIHRFKRGIFNQFEWGVKIHLIDKQKFNLSIVNHIVFPSHFKNLKADLSEVSILIGSMQMTPTFSVGTSLQYTFTSRPENDFNYSLAFYYDMTKKDNVYVETFGDLFNNRLINNLNIGINHKINDSLEWQAGFGIGIAQSNQYVSSGLVWQIN